MARTKNKEPKLHPELAFFLPPLSQEEYETLRQSIIDDGIRDPIYISEQRGWILDGHNRFNIAKELKLKYRVVVVDCETLDDAKMWMLKKQLGQRNLNPEKLSHFRGELYNRTKKDRASNLPNCHDDNLGGSTAEKLAETFKVSPATIVRDGKFAAGVNGLPETVKAEVLSGTSTLTKKEIIAAAPVKCDKCIRLKIDVKDCPQCAVAREQKKKSKSAKPEPKLKSGQPIFDWSGAEADVGKVIRIADNLARAYPKEKGGPLLNELMNRAKAVGHQLAAARKKLA